MKRHLPLILVLFILAACNSTGPKNDPDPKKPDIVKAMSYSILKEYPHDTSFFTQGLMFHNGNFYEGTGERGHSRLMQIDLATGKVLKQVNLEKEYFGEGIATWGDSLFQLTWEEHKVFVYEVKTFKKIAEFTINTEGWGITSNGNEMIVSDGSSNLYFYDPKTFRLLRTQGVYENGELAFNLNELEYINGYVYANQWNMPYILRIDPASGQVLGKADVSEIWQRMRQIDPMAEVPNGIAYDSVTKKTYITGKRWPKIFEVQFSGN